MKRAVLLVAAVSTFAGCATHSAAFRYEPHPMELVEAGDAGREARVMISVVGLRYADDETGRPAGMELAVRLENLAAASLTFDPKSMSLLSADLRPFVRPIVDPADPITLAAGQSANFTALFALTAEVNAQTADLTGLNVQLSYRLPDRTVERSATFRRLPPDYGDHHPHFHGVFRYGYYCD